MWSALVEAQGKWHRFDRYEIRGGIVQPAEGAGFHAYDPWAEPLRDPDGGGTSMVNGLLGIAEAVAPFRADPAGGPGPPPEGIGERVLGWCARFGLLGLWQHQLVVAFLPPRGTGDGRDRVIRVRAGHAATSALEARRHPAGSRGTALWSLLPARFGEAARMAWTAVADPPRARARGLWAGFFPRTDGPELSRRAYGFPLREGFWRGYGEPLESFLSAAVLWRDFAIWAASCGSRDEESWARAGDSVAALLGGLYPALGLARGQAALKWRANSLLAALASMAVLQGEDEREKPFPCAVCGRWTTSSRPQSRYCSPRCRKTANMRAFRAKRRRRDG